MQLTDFGVHQHVSIRGRMSTVPGLAVTKTFPAKRKYRRSIEGKMWSITHVPSLLRVGDAGLWTYRQAQAVCALLSHLTDWTQSEDTIRAAIKAADVDRVYGFMRSAE